jgi:hypothetical protein
MFVYKHVCEELIRVVLGMCASASSSVVAVLVLVLLLLIAVLLLLLLLLLLTGMLLGGRASRLFLHLLVVVVMALKQFLAQLLLTFVDVLVESVAVLADRKFLVVVD